MTLHQLLADLRRRFPTFTVSWTGDLIRVEIPDAQTVWISLNTITGTVRLSADRQAVYALDAFLPCEVGHYDDLDKLLCMVVHSLPSPPRAEDLRCLIGGPFDGVARDWARAIAAGIRARVDRRRAEIAADLAAAQARADREGAAADLEMKRAWSYLEILEPTP